MAGGLGLILPSVLGAGLDFLTANLFNARNEARTREAIRGFRSRIGDQSPEQTRRDLGLPGFTAGGQTFAPPGATGNVNLDELFKIPFDTNFLTGQALGDIGVGRGNAVAALDTAGRDVRTGLAAARFDPNQRAAQVGDLLSTRDFQDTLRSTLQGIGAASGIEQNRITQDIAGRALAGGKSLEEAGSQLEAARFTANRGRALQSSGARAATEQLSAQRENLRARLQTQALLDQARINAQLAQTGIEETGRLARSTADTELQAGINAGGIRANLGSLAADLAETQTGNAAATFLEGIQANREAGILSREQRLNAESLLAQLLAGVQDVVPLVGTQAGNAIGSNFAQIQAARAGRARSNPFSASVSVDPTNFL